MGSSPELDDHQQEVEKAILAAEYGAHTVMDLSTGPRFREVRRAIIDAIQAPIGTVPIYQAGIISSKNKGAVVDMDEDDMFSAIEEQAREGVDFMTLHCGITQDMVEKIQR